MNLPEGSTYDKKQTLEQLTNNIFIENDFYSKADADKVMLLVTKEESSVKDIASLACLAVKDAVKRIES